MYGTFTQEKCKINSNQILRSPTRLIVNNKAFKALVKPIQSLEEGASFCRDYDGEMCTVSGIAEGRCDVARKEMLIRKQMTASEAGYCSVYNMVSAEQRQITNLDEIPPVYSWNLTLANPWSFIPEGYVDTINLVSIGIGSHMVDERCFDELQRMFSDLRNAGVEPLVTSSFRTTEAQAQIFNDSVNKYLCQGYSYDDAYKLTAKSVAIPGTSEHQLGLALDISNKKAQDWLIVNSYKYGFIMRYPSSKSAVTGIKYEPWHYRYVGIRAATEMYQKDCCLEEYLQMLE